MAVNKKKKKKKKSTALKVIKYIFLIILAVVAMLGCVALGAYVGAKNSAPELTETNVLPATYPSSIYDVNGTEIIQLSSGGDRRTEATSEEIPETLKWAFIDLEDERFYEHNGIDLKGIIRAGYTTLTTSRKEGASTITQQLIKNNVFETGGFERSTGSTIRRKIQEWYLAVQLEKVMSKEEILLNYLNTINLAVGNYGVKEAASFYFGKDVKDLSVSECAVIASITQNPSANNPARNPENNWVRAQKCLKSMYKNGHITKQQYDEAMNDNVYGRIVAVANQTAGGQIYSYYVDEVVVQVMRDLQTYAGYTKTQASNAVYSGGLQIYSYQNPTAQEIIDREINDESNYPGFDISYSISWSMTVRHADGSAESYDQNDIISYHNPAGTTTRWYLDFYSKDEADACVEEFKSTVVTATDTILYEKIYYTLQPQASFTLMDYRTGAVIALCGGRGAKETSMSLDRAVDTNRQPGSTFKVVSAFAPALDMGVCTLATAFVDEEYKYYDTDKYVKNWWGDTYEGLSTIREGIQESMNIVACKTMMYAGVQNCLSYVWNFGYESVVEADAALSTAIGGLTVGVSNIENCAAYSAIANDGVYKEPKFYSKVLDKDGNVILDGTVAQDTHQVIRVETASLLTDAMRDVVNYGTGVLCDIDSAPLAGKTGTTNDYRDLWFVGYVPNGLCSCIWVGYDENMSLQANDEVQKEFYSIIMDQLVVALGAEGGEFELKGDIVAATVCDKSGLLNNGYCSSDPEGSCLIDELFINGTVPTETCTSHGIVTVCAKSGDLPSPQCKNTTTNVIRYQRDLIDTFDFVETIHTGVNADSPYYAPTKVCEECAKETATTTKATETTTAGGEPVTEEPATEEPEPVTEEPTAEEPTAEEPTGEEPGVDD